jgi:hypothetical protein
MIANSIAIMLMLANHADSLDDVTSDKAVSSMPLFGCSISGFKNSKPTNFSIYLVSAIPVKGSETKFWLGDFVMEDPQDKTRRLARSVEPGQFGGQITQTLDWRQHVIVFKFNPFEIVTMHEPISFEAFSWIPSPTMRFSGTCTVVDRKERGVL